MQTLSCLLAGVATASVLTALAPANIIVDDFSTNTLGNYTVSNGRTLFNYDAANERVTTLPNGAVYAMGNNASIGTGADGTYTASIDVLIADQATATSGAFNLAAVSVATAADGPFGATYTGFEMTLRGSSLNTATNFLRFRINGGSTGQLVSSDFALSPNTWYTLSTTFSPVAGTQYTVSGLLVERDTLTAVGTLPPATVTLPFADDAALFAGFAGSQNPNRGAVALDNFVVVPEPTGVGALLAVGALVLRRRRN